MKQVRKAGRTPWVIAITSALVLVFGAWALRRAEANVNEVALAAEPKGVSAVRARSASFQATRRYVGTLEPWLRAGIGPQLASGYVGSVLVRPGSAVARGAVLATLDCRNATAASRAVDLEARALEARQRAAAKEAARIQEMFEGGYVSPNEAEQSLAQAEATHARIESLRAQVEGKQLQVSDCVMRAPFAGEVAERFVDPGAFVKPGATLVTLIDRDIVRLTLDVPEVDYDNVAPGKRVRIRMLASDASVSAPVARRSPYADRDTRTIHVEIDLADTHRALPVGTTAVVEVDVGAPERALELPLTAASIRGARAALVTVVDGRASKVQAEVLGERGSTLFVRPFADVAPIVVTEGRSKLAPGDVVSARVGEWR